MSSVDVSFEQPPEAEPTGPGSIAAELDRLEIQTYAGLGGIAEAAASLAAASRRQGLEHSALRAELVRSDAMSRGGQLHEAVELQRSIAQAGRDRSDTRIQARAGCLLAATYYRLGLRSESQAAAADGVALLDERCPEQWHVEHYMVLALFTSYDRAGAVDFGLFEEAVRRARLFAEPTLLLAVLNNYAWTAEQTEGRASTRGRAGASRWRR